MLSHIITQLTTGSDDPQPSADKCSNDYKVLLKSARHLTVREEGGGEIPAGILFIKACVVTPMLLRAGLIWDAHGSGHQDTRTNRNWHAKTVAAAMHRVLCGEM